MSTRGLASATHETRLRVARSGGKAKHEKYGLQSADEETRQRVAMAGGLALGVKRRKAVEERKAREAANERR